MTWLGSPIRVLIVGDGAIKREASRTLLNDDETISIVGRVSRSDDAPRMAHMLRPDVVLMGMRQPGMDVISATHMLTECHPRMQVLILTACDDDASIVAALEAGAAGSILADTPSDQLVRAIHAVHRGEAIISPRVARKVIAALRMRPQPFASQRHWYGCCAEEEGREPLNSRETDVLRLAATGLMNREIGERLHLAEGTVKNYMSSVLAKLRMRDRMQAVLYAKDQQLI